MKHSEQLSRAFKCRRFSSVIEFIVVYLLCFLLSAIISLACFRRSYDLLINHLSFKFHYQSSQRLNISIIHFKYSRHQLAKFQLAKFITSSILLSYYYHREASPLVNTLTQSMLLLTFLGNFSRPGLLQLYWGGLQAPWVWVKPSLLWFLSDLFLVTGKCCWYSVLFRSATNEYENEKCWFTANIDKRSQ